MWLMKMESKVSREPVAFWLSRKFSFRDVFFEYQWEKVTIILIFYVCVLFYLFFLLISDSVESSHFVMFSLSISEKRLQ